MAAHRLPDLLLSIKGDVVQHLLAATFVAMISTVGVAAQSRPTPMGTSGSNPNDQINIRDFTPPPKCDGVADDSPSIYAATAALAGSGRVINVPGDCRLNIGPAARLAGHRITLDGTGLVGEIGRDSGFPYGTRGSTILLTDMGAAAFIAKRNWRLERLVFYWPGETEATALANGGVPLTMPALLAGANTSAPGGGSPEGESPSEVSAGRFADNDVVNAWDVMDFSRDVTGALDIRGNRAFFQHAFLHLSSMATESFVHDNQFSPNAFFNALGVGVGPTYQLYNHASTSAVDVLVTGNGTANAVSGSSVDDLKFFGNTTFGIGYGFRLLGGTLNLLDVNGNEFDAVPHVVSIETGGAITGGKFDGGLIYSYTSIDKKVSSAVATPVFYAAGDAAPGASDVDINDVTVMSASGSLLNWSAPRSNVRLNAVHALGTNSAVGPTADAIMWDADGRLSVIGSTEQMYRAEGSCIHVTAAMQLLLVEGNTFIGCGYVISLDAAFAPTQIISGNVALGTRNATAYGGVLAQALSDVSNAWDKPGPNWSRAIDGRNSGLHLDFQGSTKLALSTDGTLTTGGSLHAPDLDVAGTGSVQAHWITAPLTPTIENGGLKTAVAGLSYRKFGRTVTYNVQVTLTNLGSGSGALTLHGLPFPQDAGSFCILTGKDVSVTGKGVTMTIAPGSSNVVVTYIDGSYPNASGLILVASGTCQASV